MTIDQDRERPETSSDDLERIGRYRVPRSAPPPVLSDGETLEGRKPGSRRVRLTPLRERPFERVQQGYRATEAALRPRSRPEKLWRSFKRILIGVPLPSHEIEEQKIPKTKALAVFSSDALSSSAYATDEILLVLVAAGTGALTHSIAIAIAIGALLAIVTFSYRQTIRAYPNGGGAYIVAKENLGNVSGLTAAAALAVDYVLTVAVSVAAGVFAITSAFSELHPYTVEIALGLTAFITLANLRGIRESSTIFAVPTYAFIVAFSALLVVGFARILLDPGLRAPVPSSAVEPGAAGLSLFLILRAFASGSAALTGVEAISNGIPAFKKPESRNAATTLLWMAAILGVFFIGLTILAHQLDVQHADRISVPAQIAQAVFGQGPVFYLIQAATALILVLAANTSYADFPRLASILAKDQYLPHQFTFRGDRLGFSHGIVALGLAACILLAVFRADLDKLIPLYAFGVFVSFTLSQSGMVVHWLRLREPGWKRSIAVNAVGALATGVVAAIVGATKFADGAWISMGFMAILATGFTCVHHHYQRVSEQLAVAEAPAWPVSDGHSKQAVVVPVDELNKAVLRTLDYARTLSTNVVAVHMADEGQAGRRFFEQWEGVVPDIPVVIIESPSRSFLAPLLAYIDAVDRSNRGGPVTVLLPQVVPSHFWAEFLHNQSSARLKRALLHRPHTVLVSVPYHLEP